MSQFVTGTVDTTTSNATQPLDNGTTGVKQAQTYDSMGVEAGMSIRGYDRTKIYFESLQQDPIMNNMNLIEPIKVESGEGSLKSADKIIVKAKPNKDVGKAADSVVLEYVQALQLGSLNGNDVDYAGNEETKRVKYLTVYANDAARPLSSWGFGIDKLGQDWWQIDAQDRKLLSQWLGETNGLFARQAFCEKYSENLAESPINATLGINPNVIFAEPVTVTTQVVEGVATYDANLATFTANIVAGGGATTPADNHLTVPRVLKICDIMSQRLYISPIPVAGKMCYKMHASREEMRYLRSKDNAESYAESYIQGSALARVSEIVPEAELMIGDMIICTDDRAPSMSTNGAAVSFGYMKQGRNDSRVAPAADSFNVNIAMGANALVCYEREMASFKTDDDNYGKNKGTLIYECIGYNLTIWDLDPANQTSATAANEGSVLILTAREQTE